MGLPGQSWNKSWLLLPPAHSGPCAVRTLSLAAVQGPAPASASASDCQAGPPHFPELHASALPEGWPRNSPERHGSVCGQVQERLFEQS